MTGFAAILIALGLHGPAMPAEQGAAPIPPARVVGYQEQGLACRSCVEATLAALQNQDSRQPLDSAGQSSLARAGELPAHSYATARLIHPEGLEPTGSKPGIRPGVAAGSAGALEATTSGHRPANSAVSSPSQLTPSGLSKLSEHTGLPMAAGGISEWTVDLYAISYGRSDLQIRPSGMQILKSNNQLRPLYVIRATPARVFAFEEQILNESGAQRMFRSVLTAGYKSCMHRAASGIAGQGMVDIGDSRSGPALASQKTPRLYLQLSNQTVAAPATSGASIHSTMIAIMGDLKFNTMDAVFRAHQSQSLWSSTMGRCPLLVSASERGLARLKRTA